MKIVDYGLIEFENDDNGDLVEYSKKMNAGIKKALDENHGESGVYIGSEEPQDDKVRVWINTSKEVTEFENIKQEVKELQSENTKQNNTIKELQSENTELKEKIQLQEDYMPSRKSRRRIHNIKR